MLKFGPYLTVLSSVFLISLLSTTAALFGFSTQFHIWEFRIDSKLLAFAILITYFGRTYRWNFGKCGLKKWNPETNISAFLSPLPLLVIVVVAGTLLGKTHYEDVENSFTFLLATVVDIPAIYFFSITVVLLEEIIFRGVVLDLISQEGHNLRSVLVSSLIWAAASLDGLARIRGANASLVAYELLNIVAVGVVCSSLYCISKSVWPGYSFRIGMQIFSSAFLVTKGTGVDAFFSADSHIFSSNGLLMSVLSFSFGYAILATIRNTPIHRKIRYIL